MTCQCLTDYVKVAFHMMMHLLMMMMSTSLPSDDDDVFIDPRAFMEPDDPDYY